ncbi:aconitase X [Streptomyces viridochromogenes]|uniref:aconitase X n=1 Tax=Streptomyces viridochromogenes TaxID=1938 RepID=UPI00031D08B6|nr:aconitase X catalytic domain-containing protein [Streptomyces viridochromogenes]
MTALCLTADEQEMLDGAQGPAVALAMRVVTSFARARGADRLVEIAHAHIDSCLYHGPVGLDFVRRLRELGGRVRVPTTLNVGALDLLHPSLVGEDPDVPELHTAGRELMTAYADLGARPTYTCAPYQHEARPGLGEHIAWAESNAIAFANSVLGARTDRYGDFLDICAALTGRAPYAGLHRDEQRAARLVLDCTDVPGIADPGELTVVGIGALLGRIAGTEVAAVVGLPSDLPEERLKALCAVAASTGSVALVHVVGRTPEATTLDAALHGRRAERVVTVTGEEVARELASLSTVPAGLVDAVCVGTPHASLAELGELARLATEGPVVRAGVRAVVNTSRGTFALAQEAGLVAALRSAGWTLLTDTCSYIAPVLPRGTRTVATDSGKWAAYAPANLGVDVVLTTTAGCVEASRTGFATGVGRHAG